MNDRHEEQKTDTIPPNLRLLFVLEQIAHAGTPVTPTAVNEQLKLPKPTIHRLFTTLEDEGFLQRDLDGKSYTAGRRMRKLSINVLSSLRIRTARHAVMRALTEDIGETCNLAVPDRDAMIYLDRVETSWPLRIQLPIGSQVPFYCTASGKMYLSTLNTRHLDRYLKSIRLNQLAPSTITDRSALQAEILATRDQQYATDDEEFMEGMVAVAVPIRDDQGRLLSTLSFHAPTIRLSMTSALNHLERLRQAAGELSKLINE